MIEGAFYAIKRTNLIRRFIGIQESESAAYFGVCEELAYRSITTKSSIKFSSFLA